MNLKCSFCVVFCFFPYLGSAQDLSHSEDQEEILNFLETIHNHYAEKKVELVKAHKLREKQAAKKKKELAENPSKPEDMKIIFWNNDSNL